MKRRINTLEFDTPEILRVIIIIIIIKVKFSL